MSKQFPTKVKIIIKNGIKNFTRDNFPFEFKIINALKKTHKTINKEFIIRNNEYFNC